MSNLLTKPTLISNNPIAIWGVINSILLIYFNKSSTNNSKLKRLIDLRSKNINLRYEQIKSSKYIVFLRPLTEKGFLKKLIEENLFYNQIESL